MRLTNHFIHKKVKALARQSGKRQSNFCTLKDAISWCCLMPKTVMSLSLASKHYVR